MKKASIPLLIRANSFIDRGDRSVTTNAVCSFLSHKLQLRDTFAIISRPQHRAMPCDFQFSENAFPPGRGLHSRAFAYWKIRKRAILAGITIKRAYDKRVLARALVRVFVSHLTRDNAELDFTWHCVTSSNHNSDARWLLSETSLDIYESASSARAAHRVFVRCMNIIRYSNRLHRKCRVHLSLVSPVKKNIIEERFIDCHDCA